MKRPTPSVTEYTRYNRQQFWWGMDDYASYLGKTEPVALISLPRPVVWANVKGAVTRANHPTPLHEYEGHVVQPDKIDPLPLCDIEKHGGKYFGHYERYCPDFSHHQLAVLGHVEHPQHYKGPRSRWGRLAPTDRVVGIAVLSLVECTISYPHIVGGSVEQARAVCMDFAVRLAQQLD